MRTNLGALLAVFGSTLTALSLTGSTEKPASRPNLSPPSPVAAQLRADLSSGAKQFRAGRYLEARAIFLSNASLALRVGSKAEAADNFNNAGGSALARQDLRDALDDFLQARQLAQQTRRSKTLNIASNNLASLYLMMGKPEAALRVASEALSATSASEPGTRSFLQVQIAAALSSLHRFPEASPLYRKAAADLQEQADFDAASRVLANWGSAALEAGELTQADTLLTQALWLVRMHNLPESANLLRGLAKARDRQGDFRAAAALFASALHAPQRLTPQWLIYADRGEFRLRQNDLRGALSDFRDARRLASLMRADIVPADQDRVAMETGLSRLVAGLVEAGNRLARQTSDRAFLRETFDAAEQDRLWSLRALVPSANDWRTRLPAGYWDKLTQYQRLERAFLAEPSPALSKQSSILSTELAQLEAHAAAGDPAAIRAGDSDARAVSPLARIKSRLDADSVLFSFHIGARGGWIWALDNRGVDVYPVPPLSSLEVSIARFVAALRTSRPEAAVLGHELYLALFGSVSASYLSHQRWLLELDGPLFDLPFAALVTSEPPTRPAYLVERAELEAIPGALLPRAAEPSPGSGFLGIGDPVYNQADSRYEGARRKSAPGLNAALPRLQGTAGELAACSRAWGPDAARVITGMEANLAGVQGALQAAPSVIHFATHVLPGSGDFSSGVIALSLDQSGAIGLLGPKEILAHPVTARLIVLNGCHSAEGETLPGAGLMGLTRAWLGAGAGAVLATRWDIPDEAGQNLMTVFYRELRANWARGPAFALRRAQLEAMRNQPFHQSAILGAYFLLGRA